LGAVANLRNVADGVERVAQVLQDGVVGMTDRRQLDEAEGQWVVGVIRPDAVAVVDRPPLPFRVVVDVRDERRDLRSAAQINVDAFEQVCVVYTGALSMVTLRPKRPYPRLGQ
jgi:hypothetical protein